MKKLNNKGFAISTILYSLLIMVFLIVALLMGIMSSNRQNTKELVNTIEDELNRYSLTSTEFLPVTNGTYEAQEYIVPYGQAGWYKIELWGASGGDGTDSAKGGAGAYTSGIIYLEENTLIYFYVGEQANGTTGGFNGGGDGNGTSQGGGGATDVRYISGAWDDESSIKSRIMVAAGGGGATANKAGQGGGTLETMATTTGRDGATQTAGGIAGTDATAGELAKGGTGATDGAGGGGGYYGGGGGGADDIGGGGSSFISGYAGVAIDGSYEKTKMTVQVVGSDPPVSEDLYFIDGMMAESVNVGSGRAKIELISKNTKNNRPTKKTSKLNNVRYIQDCINGIGDSTAPQWLEIQAMQNGVNIAYNEGNVLTNGERSTSVTAGTYGTSTCQTIDLGRGYTLDEIAIWHTARNESDMSQRVLYNHEIKVSSNNTDWRTIRASSSTEPMTGPEENLGVHLSAWDPDSGSAADLPNGTYYLFSALSPNTSLITAQNSLISVGNAFQRYVSLAQINGSNLQKWTITKEYGCINTDDTGACIAYDNYYRIVEKESNQALQIVDNLGQEIKDDSGQYQSNISTSSSYSETYLWAKWKIISLGDGTYRIKSVVQPSTDESQHTYLATGYNEYGMKASTMVLKKYSTDVESLSQRFYIMSAE